MSRAPGTPNRKSSQVEGICLEKNFNSIEAMIDAAKIALEKFIEHSEKEHAGTISLMESKAHDYLKMYIQVGAHISKFRYPQLKSIEVTKNEVLDGMTPEQKLEAMKQAVLMLEAQMKEPK